MTPKFRYHSAGSARDMMARTMTTVGTRHGGRMPMPPPLRLGGAGGRAPAPGPGLAYQGVPYVPYEAAKRMGLGGLGAAGSSLAPPVGAGATGGAAIGASQGATIGSAVVPVIGTAIGAVIGAIGGAIAGSINKKDPEQYNFDAAVALWQQNPNAVYSIGNKYLPLAGLFDLDLKGPHIPIYQKYGRMGEQRFVTDLVNKIYTAAQQGQITANDTALTVMSRVVQPWIDSWGYGPMQDPHADLINKLIIGMIQDYAAGQQRNWTARGGDYPFASLPAFTLPAAPAISAASATAPPAVAPAGNSPNMAPAGTTLQHDTNATMVTPIGTFASLAGGAFTFTPPGGQIQQFALTPAHTGGYGTLSVTWTGSQAVITQSDGTQAIYDVPSGKWIPVGTATIAPPPASTSAPAVVTPVLPPPVSTATPPASVIPSSFNQVATDQAGNPVFANAQGVLYQWNGTSMVQFTGTLATNSSQAAQMQAAIQTALAQGYSSAQAAQAAIAQQQAAGQTIPPAIQTQVADQAATTAAAPTVTSSVTPTTAGVSLGGTTGLVAVGLTILGVMFATARPAGKKKRAARG